MAQASSHDASQFSADYERYVDVLCWAAKEGVNRLRAERYQALRRQLQDRYGRLAPIITASYAAGKPDPFAALLAPASLADALADPFMIDAIMESRALLEAVLAPQSIPQLDG